MRATSCQRWRDRRALAVPGDTLINPAVLAVDVIPEWVARLFVTQHHYSGTFPAARLSVGLFRGCDLVGAAVFSEGIQPAAMPKWTGVSAAAGCELGRLVLLDDVAGNAESWFGARAFRALRAEKPAMESVLTYADPVERWANGRLVKPGHVGIIYQALNARYRGRASRRTDYFAPSGEHVSRRALSKIMLGEIGEGYAVDQLHRLGAPRRERFETGRDWIARLIEIEGWLRGRRHPGNHTYVFPLSDHARAVAAGLTVQPYPKLGA